MAVKQKQRAIVIDDASFFVVTTWNWGEKMTLWQEVANIYATPVYSQKFVTLQVLAMLDLCGQLESLRALAPVISTQYMFSINNLLPIDFQCGRINIPDPPQGAVDVSGARFCG